MEPKNFDYYDIHQKMQRIKLEKGSLAFTICQVPVIYKKGSEPSITTEFTDGKINNVKGKVLDYETTQTIFKRSYKVKMLIVHVNK